MDYLLEHCTHPTADEIYLDLSVSIPTLSKTTIYNTLKLFSEQGVIQMLTIDEKNVCFDAGISPHAHFLCKKCGTIYDMPIEKQSVEELNESANTGGHQIAEMHYYYKGVCEKCV
jgi:Fur family ferric uptake transcriptional regulator/Fur family peroxide stress response transcriptional regulator